MALFFVRTRRAPACCFALGFACRVRPLSKDRALRVVLARLVAAATLFSFVQPSWTWADTPAVAQSGSVSGVVTTGDGVPIGEAVVGLQGAGAPVSQRTDSTGHFSISGLASGTYALRVNATGYGALGPRAIGVRPATATNVSLALVRSPSSLTTIGRVISAGGEALTTSATPVTTIDPQPYAAQGYTRMSDVLQDDISTTLVHSAGGGSTLLPTSVALRGPDPTETLVDIDGHQVNSGATGDFDLSLLDPADYGSVELVRGIAPSSLIGPDTIDGAINIRTLEPTQTPHGLVRFSAGSFNSFGETLQSTGTQGRLGYAFSLHKTTTAGEVNGPVFDTNTGAPAAVGSGVDGTTALAKLRYAFGPSGGGYAELSFHGQRVSRDLSAALSSLATSDGSESAGLPVVAGFSGSSLAAHNAGYGLDVRVPLGASGNTGSDATSLLFRHYTSLVSQAVVGAAAETSPYLYSDRDLIGENSLEFGHQFRNGGLTLQYAIRNEGLTITDASGGSGDINLETALRRFPVAAAANRLLTAGSVAASFDGSTNDTLLAQTQRFAVLRYTYEPTAQLHLTAAGYYSDYSIFGHQIDPRLGLVYTPDSRSAVRFSAGTTYQAPQLPELYVPSVLPAPVGGIITTGNPNLQPDHATEYGLGASRVIETGPHRTDLAVDFYRVNLRQPAATYTQPGTDASCGTLAGGDGTPCPLSYAVNAGNGVYTGIELSAQRRLAPSTTVRAGYAVRSAYLTSVPPEIQDGSFVIGQQSRNLPLHKATLNVSVAPPRGFTLGTQLVYEGTYNELNQPPFVTLAASVGYRWPSFELLVSGTNLTNVYDGRFINTGNGQTYGAIGTPLSTDAYPMQGTALTISLARRF